MYFSFYEEPQREEPHDNLRDATEMANEIVKEKLMRDTRVLRAKHVLYKINKIIYDQYPDFVEKAKDFSVPNEDLHELVAEVDRELIIDIQLAGMLYSIAINTVYGHIVDYGEIGNRGVFKEKEFEALERLEEKYSTVEYQQELLTVVKWASSNRKMLDDLLDMHQEGIIDLNNYSDITDMLSR